MKESYLVNKIIKSVRAKYPTAYVRKLSDRFTRGLPDILIVYNYQTPFTDGPRVKVLLVEAKAKNGRVSPIQHAEMCEILRSGAAYLIAMNVEIVADYMAGEGAIP